VDGGALAQKMVIMPETGPSHHEHRWGDEHVATRAVLRNFAITEREADVAVMLLQGYRVGDIAQRLHHSPHTIRNRVRRLFAKTSTSNHSQFVSLIRRHLEAMSD
jgi:DNA-binding CsgD family transcriptional regulator